MRNVVDVVVVVDTGMFACTIHKNVSNTKRNVVVVVVVVDTGLFACIIHKKSLNVSNTKGVLSYYMKWEKNKPYRFQLYLGFLEILLQDLLEIRCP